MKVVAIIQARMSSSRLPGKVLKPILGKPIIAWMMERLSRAQSLNHLILAIPDEPGEETLAAFAAGRGMSCYRGPRDDVLARFEGAVEACAPDADIIVRVTSDCPLLDPVIVDHCVNFFITNFPAFHYVAPQVPPTLPNGMSVEVFTRAALNRAHKQAVSAYDREHVTPFMQKAEEGFSVGRIPFGLKAGHIRLCVDTHEDYAMISALIEKLAPIKPDFNLADILNLLEAHPEILALNSHVRQTTGAYGET
ncbi:cytidylyltransferase domain-containing protein [Woodsholea maritima]|uniref:cytidylyltransferase domain-containing protein n=1 Tax=Woodsholea maritima TaxID=240237 RepID=UPI000366A594|nr:glycosyltransferase family protein [Woodsholea maritima]